MYKSILQITLLCVVTVSALAATDSRSELNARQLLSSPYAPSVANCPSTALVRPATALSAQEASWIPARKKKATSSLQKWLASTGLKFGPPKDYPTLALACSGGGARAFLLGAGVHQALDGRDGKFSTSGLYQAMTYESGLSGGGWLLGSISDSNWDTVSNLKNKLWYEAFRNSIFVPNGLGGAAVANAAITQDILAKQLAGYNTSLIDAYGRLLGYQFVSGSNGGVAKKLSSLATLSNFKNQNVPYPIITAIGSDLEDGECVPSLNGTQYEFAPFEFGSWDKGVSAFTPTKYLGSSLKNGKPSVPGKCVTGYDNTGFIIGTSSDIFAAFCQSSDLSSIPGDAGASLKALQGLLNAVHTATSSDVFAPYPNPFYNYRRSSLVKGDKTLYLIDGGLTNQNNPIWPYLYRPDVEVLLVSDNSADTNANFPNGSEIYTTYLAAKAAGLSRMPVIPPVSTFIARKFDQRPVFFGCNSPNTLTIVYLPNKQYNYPSGQSTFRSTYAKSDVDGMIANGVNVATYGKGKDWGACLACGIMKKAGGTLPAKCTKCFKDFCFN